MQIPFMLTSQLIMKKSFEVKQNRSEKATTEEKETVF